MALTEVQTKPKQSGGGGALGSVLGGLAGLVAAPFTGGASIPAAMGLMGAGASLGGMAGSMIDPAEAKQGRRIETSRTAMAEMPEVQAAELTDAATLVDALPQSTPEEKSLLKSNLLTARQAILDAEKAKQKIFGFGGR